jgi:hypothetical protein
MNEIDEVIEQINKINKKNDDYDYSKQYPPEEFYYYIWECPHCGVKMSISKWHSILDDDVDDKVLKHTCSNCGRQRYELIPDIVDDHIEYRER